MEHLAVRHPVRQAGGRSLPAARLGAVGGAVQPAPGIDYGMLDVRAAPDKEVRLGLTCIQALLVCRQSVEKGVTPTAGAVLCEPDEGGRGWLDRCAEPDEPSGGRLAAGDAAAVAGAALRGKARAGLMPEL